MTKPTVEEPLCVEIILKNRVSILVLGVVEWECDNGNISNLTWDCDPNWHLYYNVPVPNYINSNSILCIKTHLKYPY